MHMPLLGDMWYMYFAVVLIHVPLNMPTMLVDAADPLLPCMFTGMGC